MRFTYSAKRSITAGHSATVQYDFIIAGARIDQEFDAIREETISLSGEQESDLQRIDEMWSCTTDFVETPERRALFEEFLHSVMGGEQFTFDPDATGASDVDPHTVVLVSKGVRRRRVGVISSYTYDLRMRVVA